VKDTNTLLEAGGWSEVSGGHFVGNVEGRDLMAGEVDVVVTDGFTGNVALKTLEGAMRSLIGALTEVFFQDEQTTKAAEVLLPALQPLVEKLDPDFTGGALLLGVKGYCVISHGSSSAGAMVNAIKVAGEMVEADLVGSLTAAVAVEADA
jgi:glycerol-3-phosphate acyltransferase PlsX